jgi:VanZ family protein
MRELVYGTIGKQFFTYAVFLLICACLAACLFFLFFKYRVKSSSQYAWLLLCAGGYIYYTFALRKYPEEAVHFVEYGLLAFLLFRALSARIHDNTIYMTTLVLIALLGAFDEFVQWLLPSRFWDYRDVGFNSVAGLILMVAIWKAIRPENISGPIKGYSLKMLASALTLNLMFLGLCLSNTPETVKRYTSAFKGLSWLLSEEPMTEYGYKYRDPGIGIFYSRMSLEEMKEIDRSSSGPRGKKLRDRAVSDEADPVSEDEYTPYTDPFLYEFYTHVSRRAKELFDAEAESDPQKRAKLFNKAYRENVLLEKHFPVTLEQAGLEWQDKKTLYVRSGAGPWKKEYKSKAGLLITFIDLKTSWALILCVLSLAWAIVFIRGKRAG